LEIYYNLSTAYTVTTTTVWFLSMLFIIAIAASVTMVFFVKNRLKLKKQEGAAQLLRMVVPDLVSKQLVSHMKLTPEGVAVLEGDTLIAQSHLQVALCFIDICNFTILSSTMTAQGLVCFLDEFFTLIDNELQKYKNIVKIKTIGDAYFAVAGLQNDNDAGGSNDKRTSSKSSMHLMSSAGDKQKTDDGNDDSSGKQSRANLVALIDFCYAIQTMLAERRFQVAPTHRRSSPLLAQSAPAASPEYADAERLRCQQVLHCCIRSFFFSISLSLSCSLSLSLSMYLCLFVSVSLSIVSVSTNKTKHFSFIIIKGAARDDTRR
jgi:class 3 adenylate cyclase